MSNYTVEQLRKRLKELRRIWSADYFFIPKDAEELLDIAKQLPAKIEECERYRKAADDIDQAAVAWAIGKLSVCGIGRANEASAHYMDRLQDALLSIAALKEPK